MSDSLRCLKPLRGFSKGVSPVTGRGSWSMLKQGSRIQAALWKISEKKKLLNMNFLSSTSLWHVSHRIHNGRIQLNTLTVNEPWRCSVHLSLTHLLIFWRSGDSMMVCRDKLRDAGTRWSTQSSPFPTMHAMIAHSLTNSFLELTSG